MKKQQRAGGGMVETLEVRRLFAAVPTGFGDTLVAGGISTPTAMEFSPDGRLFVLQQGGRITVIKNGAKLPNNALVLSVNADGERGLLGITFDPNFTTNKYVYLYYTTNVPTLHNRLSRFVVNGDVIDPASEKALLDVETLSGATNHNGGALHFGPDGKLFVAVGDNAAGANAQSMTTLKGKMLRINSDGTIPTDNPFYTTNTGVHRAIWATGLRNPYTFAFQAGTGRMFINDVGQNTVEEINEGKAGANYGWPGTEGPTTLAGVTNPFYSYAHPGLARAITGAAFYNPANATFPADYAGDFLFADFVLGQVSRIDPVSKVVSVFATGVSQPVDFRVSSDGQLYYLSHAGGTDGLGSVGRIQYTAGTRPVIVGQPANLTKSIDESAVFGVNLTGSQPITYQWYRNGRLLRGETNSTYTIHTVSAANNGSLYTVIVKNQYGTATSAAAKLTVLSNHAPTPTITSPSGTLKYKGAQIIPYAGAGTDAEDGTLAASKFMWQVDFHHADHVHPFLAAFGGVKGGTFTIPTTGETSADVFYRIILTVTDSKGARSTTFRDIKPLTAVIKLTTNIAGLTLNLDGQPSITPVTFTGVAGVERVLTAPATQVVNGKTYAFSKWSDGKAASHTISTPGVATTYTATYVLLNPVIATGAGLNGAYYNKVEYIDSRAVRAYGWANEGVLCPPRLTRIIRRPLPTPRRRTSAPNPPSNPPPAG